MADVVPTILTKDPVDLETKIKSLEGLVDRVQIDIIDGVFLPENTVLIETLGSIETRLKYDIHLMVNKPEEWINRCIQVMADRVIGQVEMMGKIEGFIEEGARAGLQVGLGIDVKTLVSKIAPETYEMLDLVLIMTRKAGFEEGEFRPEALQKVREIRKNYPYLDIYVDGGIKENNIKECLKAGANYLAVGGVIWRAENLAAEVSLLKMLARSSK